MLRKLKGFTDNYEKKCSDLEKNLDNLNKNMILVEVDYYNSLNSLKNISENLTFISDKNNFKSFIVKYFLFSLPIWSDFVIFLVVYREPSPGGGKYHCTAHSLFEWLEFHQTNKFANSYQQEIIHTVILPTWWVLPVLYPIGISSSDVLDIHDHGGT